MRSTNDRCSRRQRFAPRLACALVPLALAATPAAETFVAPTRVGSALSQQLLVKFRPGVQTETIRRVIGNAGAREVGAISDLDVRVLRVVGARRAAALSLLRRSSAVSYAQPDRQIARVADETVNFRLAGERALRDLAAEPAERTSRAPNDPLWPDEWSLVKLRAPEAWSVTTGVQSTVVAVLDTGVDLAQPDLQGAFVPGYDFVNGDTDPSDDYGHGTMVAGIIAARTDNGLGLASYCWRCSLMPVKVIGANGVGTSSDVAAGITWATDHGARVINMSFVMAAGDDALASAVEYAHSHDVVVVAAAGNDGDSQHKYPAVYPEVVSVGATDGADALYPWSSYGSWVKVAAPGCNVTTTTGASYAVFCGTSSATAAVSGLAGLAFSYDPTASNLVVERALEESATRVGDFVSSGRVDARAVLDALGATPARSSRSQRSAWSRARGPRTWQDASAELERVP